MKRVFLVLAFLIVTLVLPARQAKRIYITLDVSGSMSGNKYSLANYTAQMLITLCDKEDEIHMIVAGNETRLNRSSRGLGDLQYPCYRLPLIPSGADTNFEINDIIVFNRLYRPSPGKQDWLFIIGDGIWDYHDRYEDAVDDFGEIVRRGSLNVCYLQTGSSMSEQNGFTQFAATLGVVDIGKADVTPKTIKDGCDHFARKILGFSDVPMELKKAGDHGISLKMRLPVSSFFLVCQDEIPPAELPMIQEVNAGGRTLRTELRGTPSTIPTKDSDATRTLSGNVWLVKSDTPIPAGTEITVDFDKTVSTRNVVVYPIVDQVEFGSGAYLSSPGGEKKLKKLNSSTYAICKDEKKATVRVGLTEESSDTIPEDLLKDTKVIVKANNRDYKAIYKDGGFECEIDLFEDETQYYAVCDCPGYLQRVTEITTIVKGDYCDPPAPIAIPEDNIKSTINLGEVPFRKLSEPRILFIRDSLTNEILNPRLFDLEIEAEDNYLFEDITITTEDEEIILVVHPRGDWCECFFPDSLDMKIIATPKEESMAEYGKQYQRDVYPLHYSIVKEGSWLSRCGWTILALIGLVLLYVYLKALQRKRRFKKEAMVTPTYFDYRGNRIEQSGTFLRKDGFAAWLARWFWPGDEQNTLSWTKPSVISGLKFLAADSREVVLLPKEGNIDPDTMVINGYNPKKDPTPKEPVRIADRGRINVYTPNGKADGFLTFSSGDAVDGNGYRILLGLLRIACILAILLLLYLTIRSFL